MCLYSGNLKQLLLYPALFGLSIAINGCSFSDSSKSSSESSKSISDSTVPLLVALLQFQEKAKNTKMKWRIIRWLMLNLPIPVRITIHFSRA